MRNLILFIAILCTVSSFASVEFIEAKDFSELGVDSIFQRSPIDDPQAYSVEEAEYELKVLPYLWLIPGPLSAAEEVFSQRSNNNVAIEFFNNRIFAAFRTGPTHFSSKKSRMYVVSSADGRNWELEWKSSAAHNAQGPQLVSYKGRLNLYYFTGVSSPFKFRPSNVYKLTRSSLRNWSTPEEILEKGEVPWEMKVRDGLLWMTSYLGPQYKIGAGPARIKLKLKKSFDGTNFVPEDSGRDFVHLGGATEAGFEFDDEGNLYAVTRNEDGDVSGFGAHLVFAPRDLLSYWSMLSVAESWQSPRMFRHGKDIYLVARRHKGTFRYAQKGGRFWRRFLNFSRWSLAPKATALYRMNQDKRGLEHIMDLPGAGDTAFPSIRRVDKDTFLIANYTSPLHRKNRKWAVGQLGRTSIYLIALKFHKKVTHTLKARVSSIRTD